MTPTYEALQCVISGAIWRTRIQTLKFQTVQKMEQWQGKAQ